MAKNQLTITKYTLNDFDTYYALVREDSIMRYITGKGLAVAEARNKFDEILATNDEETELGYFKIHNGDGVYIGDGKLERYRPDRSMLEIGYILKEEYWGRGYGTMICRELLTLADKVAPNTDIIGIIDPDNAASKRLLEKFGFKSFFVGVEDDLPTEKLRLAKHI